MKESTDSLKRLFKQWAKEDPIEINRIAESGSYRKYFRIIGEEKTAIGVFNAENIENKAFISFTKHFLKKSLNVPKLFSQNLKENRYLREELVEEIA